MGNKDKRATNDSLGNIYNPGNKDNLGNMDNPENNDNLENRAKNNLDLKKKIIEILNQFINKKLNIFLTFTQLNKNIKQKLNKKNT